MNLISFLLICGFVTLTTAIKTPPLPTWPVNYKACVYVQSDREYIPMGWYVDGDKHRMRLDSYGIPSDFQKQTLDENNDFDYACSHLGRPLYVFIYHYDNGKEYDIFPSVNKPYQQCTVFNVSTPYPPSPLLPSLQFIEQAQDNYTTYNHWRAEYFLFTNDYFFHTANGLPYKFFVDGIERTFLFIESVQLEEDIFLVPRDISCKSG